MTRKLWILGESGHAREVELIARSVDPRGERWSTIHRIGAVYESRMRSEGGDAAMGVGSPLTRATIAARVADQDGIDWPTLVHPRADIGPSVELACGVIVASGVVVTVDVVIAEWSMLNYNVTVGHDVIIGPYCQINPHAAISGNATLGRGVLIGAGAVILEGRSIGDGATVGAGAVVTRDVERGDTVVGVPARVHTAVLRSE